MLWLVIEGASHEIVSCNIHHNKDTNKYQLWVERSNGKNLLVQESDKEATVREVKEAIDFAIEHGEAVLRLV